MEYEEWKQIMELMLDASWETHKQEIEKKDFVINTLLDKLSNKELELLSKNEIMQIFGCESDKALKILKLMYSNNFGSKVGKEYYITKNEFKKFMDSYKGKDLKL